jgi:hypothetical protein
MEKKGGVVKRVKKRQRARKTLKNLCWQPPRLFWDRSIYTTSDYVAKRASTTTIRLLAPSNPRRTIPNTGLKSKQEICRSAEVKDLHGWESHCSLAQYLL